MRPWRQSILALLTSCIFVFICLGAPETAPVAEEGEISDLLRPLKVILPLGTPSLYAGYYAAKDKGFYRDLGLDVTFEIARTSPEKRLMAKKGDLLISLTPVMMAFREKGNDIVAIGQVNQSALLQLAVRLDRKIERLKDLDGRQLVFPSNMALRAPYMEFLSLMNLKPVITLAPEAVGMELFLLKGVDGCATMQGHGMVFPLLGMGIERTKVIDLAIFDITVPGNGVFCLGSRASDLEPECRVFMEASLKGWMLASTRQDEVIDIVIRHAIENHIPANRSQIEAEIAMMLPSILSLRKKRVPGVLSEEDFNQTVSLLKKQGALKSLMAYKDFWYGWREPESVPGEKDPVVAQPDQ